jgi:hypothetical protein
MSRGEFDGATCPWGKFQRGELSGYRLINRQEQETDPTSNSEL